jgi:hypothetical protein
MEALVTEIPAIKRQANDLWHWQILGGGCRSHPERRNEPKAEKPGAPCSPHGRPGAEPTGWTLDWQTLTKPKHSTDHEKEARAQRHSLWQRRYRYAAEDGPKETWGVARVRSHRRREKTMTKAATPAVPEPLQPMISSPWTRDPRRSLCSISTLITRRRSDGRHPL